MWCMVIGVIGAVKVMEEIREEALKAFPVKEIFIHLRLAW